MGRDVWRHIPSESEDMERAINAKIFWKLNGFLNFYWEIQIKVERNNLNNRNFNKELQAKKISNRICRLWGDENEALYYTGCTQGTEYEVVWSCFNRIAL